MTNVCNDTDFQTWWRKHHPHDWWAKKLGAPVGYAVRYLVADIARRAYLAGKHDA